MKEMQQLLTKFFHKDNCLHFQILVEQAGCTEVCGEFKDYSEYRTEYQRLRQELIAQGKIKRLELPNPLARVA